MYLLPNFLRKRLEHHPNLIKILDNIGWLFFDKFLRMGVGMFVGLWIARYLGPEEFGLLGFAVAFCGLFSAFSTLGLHGVVVRDIVRDPDNATLTLGTAAILHFIGGIIAYLLVLISISYFRKEDPLSHYLVAIIGATLLFKISEIAVYWFEAQVESKYIVWIQNVIFLIGSIVKIIFILNQVTLIYFAWIMLAESVLSASVMLMLMNLRGKSFKKIRASLNHAQKLLKDSWPLILSTIAITVYMKIDQVMVGQIIGNDAVGIYSAAVKISEIWYFIPASIVASVFPMIINTKERSYSEYIVRIQKLYDLMSLISIAIALPVSFFSVSIVTLLFGQVYAAAGNVLAIYVWASIFVFLGVASGKVLLIEGRQSYVFERTMLGLIINVLLNYFFIYEYGLIGAAIATLFSYAVAGYLADIIHYETRPMFLMKTKSLNLLFLSKRICK